MKKVFFYLFLFFVCGLELHAQSSMSDEQVMKMILKEQKAGTSQSQIVTKLIQNGVDISQIRRLKAKYERYKDNKGMGNLTDENLPQTDDRLRKNNAKEKDSKEKDFSNLKLQDTKEKIKTYDKKNNNFLEMENELGTFMPTDSIKWLKELLAERDKEKRKVFGRDIFNNKELSFEPNMNISTPQKYVLGAGDAVIIDIYGASQKTINSTVSPDGDITIEGFGPVKVAGLTVEQANARLKNQLGARYSSSKIRLTVGQTKTIMINVMGEVSTPGTYTLSAFATVFHALYMAGGVNDLGTLRNIKVYRQNKLVSVVDIYDYILNGKLTGTFV